MGCMKNSLGVCLGYIFVVSGSVHFVDLALFAVLGPCVHLFWLCIACI